jgi:hypothetical protein
MSTHGLLILNALRENLRSLGRKPSDIESADVIDRYLAANGVKLKRAKKPGTPKPRVRDEIFDALAKIDGQEVTQLTRHGGARIATAKKQILEVMPEATTAQVLAEIEERAARYKRKHPTRELTAMALVTWWAELGGGLKTKAAALDIYQEPAGWQPVLCRLLGLVPEVAAAKAWHDLSPDYRMAVLKEIAKQTAA